jgi:hypothetical protein
VPGDSRGKKRKSETDELAEASYQRVAGMVQTHRHVVDATPGRQQQRLEAMKSSET